MTILLERHQRGRYCIQGRGSEQPEFVSLHSGVRQGCVLSPTIWGLFTSLLHRKFDEVNGQGWTASRATIFADDLHFKWMLSSEHDVTPMRQDIANVFQVLSALGTQANPDKSKFVIGVRGHIAKQWTEKTRPECVNCTMGKPSVHESQSLMSLSIWELFCPMEALRRRRLGTGSG